MATYHLWRDKARRFYWTLVSDKNGKIVSMSSEAYETHAGALDSIEWNKANGKTDSFSDHAR